MMEGSPVNLKSFGYINNSLRRQQNLSGYYWSSTAQSTNNAYYLYIGGSLLNATYSDYKGNGFSVRCIAR